MILKESSHYLLASTSPGKSGEVLVACKTFLELHSKAALQPSAKQPRQIWTNCKNKKLKMAPHSLSPEALRSHTGLERCHFEGVNNVFSKLLFKWVSFLLQCSWFPPTSAATLFSCEAPEMFCGPLPHSNTFFLSKKAQQWHTELKKLWQEAVIIEKKKKELHKIMQKTVE